MKISWVNTSDVGWMRPVTDHLEKLGHTVVFNKLDPSFDILFGSSISAQRLIAKLHNSFPDVPMYNYNWDVYEWAYKSWPSGIFPYDLNQYADLMRESKAVICPSESVVLRNKEFFGIPEHKSPIVRSFFRQLEIDESAVSDEGFVYMPLRQIPDINLNWFESAVKELGIPSKVSDKSLSEEDYKKVLATCTFLVCPWFEASTGGLSLLEGRRLGKGVLFSDSPYMGANDYFGEEATRFKYDDYEDFKRQLEFMWENRNYGKPSEEFFNQFSPETMAEKLVDVFKND